jgi:hypothetical protein
MKWIFLLFIVIVLTSHVHAQKQLSFSTGLNVTALSSVSNFQLQNSYDLIPGWFFGFSVVPKDYLLANIQIEYSQIGLKPIQLTDVTGSSIGTSNSKFLNFNLNLALMYRMKIEKFVIGLGVAPQFSIISKVVNKLKFQGNSSFPSVINESKVKSDNKSRKFLVLQIPFQIEYDI